MTSRVSEIIIDSQDPLILAKWWGEVLDYPVAPPSPKGAVGIFAAANRDEVPGEGAYRAAAQVPTIVFVPVPAPKEAKDRVHLDIWSIDRTQDQEVAWLESRDARRVDIGQRDVSWW